MVKYTPHDINVKEYLAKLTEEDKKEIVSMFTPRKITDLTDEDYKILITDYLKYQLHGWSCNDDLTNFIASDATMLERFKSALALADDATACKMNVLDSIFICVREYAQQKRNQ